MLYFSVFLLITIFSTQSSSINSDKYCAINKDHTMCKYDGIGHNCLDSHDYGLSIPEKKLVVNVHNQLRRKVATGKESRGRGGPQPQAANLLKFTWDSELAAIAQRWADQCRVQHDGIRQVQRWRVGQNMYFEINIPKTDPNWTNVITKWYDEVKYFPPSSVSTFRFNPRTLHYTQLVWHHTHKIGCGRRDFGPARLYFCNYGPSGNIIGTSMYKIGPPCSKCPINTRCRDDTCDNPLESIQDKINEEVAISEEEELLIKAKKRKYRINRSRNTKRSRI